MTKVPERDYLSEEVLDSLAFSWILAHPLHTFDLIEEHLDVVPLTTRMVTYQIHERCNGTGYPWNRQAPLVHQGSKVPSRLQRLFDKAVCDYHSSRSRAVRTEHEKGGTRCVAGAASCHDISRTLTERISRGSDGGKRPSSRWRRWQASLARERRCERCRCRTSLGRRPTC